MPRKTLFGCLLVSAALGLGSPRAAAQWTATTPLPEAFMGHALASSSGHLYNIGGMDGVNGILDGANVYYAPITSRGKIGNWTQGASLPESVLFHSAVAWNNALYVLGGYHYSAANGLAISNVVYYSKLNADGSPGAWSATTSLPQSLFLQSAAVWNGVVYVTGGWENQGLTNGVYSARIQADGTLGPWTAQLSLPVPTYVHVAVENGALYVIGGSINNGTTLTSAVYYTLINADGSLAGWSAAASLPQPLAQHVAAVVGGEVYVAGGWTGSAPSAGVLGAPVRSDMSLDPWVSTPSLPTPLYMHAGAVADGVLYVSGGSNGSTPQTGVYAIPLFTPASTLTASVDMDPDTLNLVSKGSFITAHLEFPSGRASAADIVIGSLDIVRVNGKAIAPIAALSRPTELDADPVTGAPRLMVKFSRAAVEAVLTPGDQKLEVDGKLSSGKAFSGNGRIWAILPGKPAHKDIDAGEPPETDSGSHGFGLVPPRGGSVSHAGGKIDIPAGALNSGLPVSVKMHTPGPEQTADPTLSAAGDGFEFGPEGTKFAQPVALTLSYDPARIPAGASEDDLAVHYWNPDSKRWELLASAVDKVHHTVSAQTVHFSLYEVMAPVPAATPAPPPPSSIAAEVTPAAASPAPAPAKPGIIASIMRAVSPARSVYGGGVLGAVSVAATAPSASAAPSPAPAPAAAAPPRGFVAGVDDQILSPSAEATPSAADVAPRTQGAPPRPAHDRRGRLLGTVLCLTFLAALWYRLVWRTMS